MCATAVWVAGAVAEAARMSALWLELSALWLVLLAMDVPWERRTVGELRALAAAYAVP